MTVVLDRLRRASIGTQRVIALSILLGLVSMVAVAVVLPVARAASEHTHWRTEATRDLARARGFAQAQGQTQTTLAALASHPGANAMYTGEVAAAQQALLADLQTIWAAAGVTATLELLPSSAAPAGLQRVSVKGSALVAMDAWTKALIAIESAPRVLVIDQLSVKAPRLQPIESNPALEIAWVVSGFVAPSPNPSTGASETPASPAAAEVRS
jgi:Type II secretion system (T2SS), protein M subtype b